MDFRYTFNRTTFLSAYRFAFWHTWRKIILAALAGAALLEMTLLVLDVNDSVSDGDTVLATFSHDPAYTSLVILGGVLLAALLMSIGPWVRTLMLYRKSPIQGAIVHVSVTAEHVEVHVEGMSRATLNWRSYDYWRENSHVFLLFLCAGGFQFFGKDGLNPEQQAELRTLIAGSLPEK